MVVIVIIGILAAIAIPKLFGMSAKAKAQEVGPAVGTWTKLVMAYKMETGDYGDPKDISYKAPGSDADAGKGATSNFSYVVEKQTWKATSKFGTDDCKEGAKWDGEFTEVSGDTPEMSMSGAGTNKQGCLSLTPNFLRIGCQATGSEAKDDKAINCKGGAAGGT
jgi:type II secretory pathway pseudopilin PulG